MSELVDRIEELAEFLVDQAEEADSLGHLPDRTHKALREVGIVKALQPRDFGGAETHPREFFEGILAIGSRSASAGWVSSVVGVHSFELAQGTRAVQEEIWGEDPDTWVASPYAPIGRAKRTDGGWIFSGRWPFSSGTDLCDWVVLGGMLTDDEGAVRPDGLRHFILPRSDYTILQDSWNVVGLKGTGSKDVVIDGAFVPDHRLIDPEDLGSGAAAEQAGRGDVPLYRMPFHSMFSGAITAGTLAAAEGALAAWVAYTRTRVSARGVTAATDPRQLHALGEAASDLQASRMQFLADIDRLYEVAASGRPIALELRAEVRRNQVRVSRRVGDAVDRLVAHAGGSAMRLDNPIQRFWRDLHIALGHGANVAEPVYQAAGTVAFGGEPPANVRM
ncbi:MAG TPA: hydroxylase [Nocardioides sp.]|uniref:hydroxylase n=1 Tax=Nocardioides sp. TaxID=35761 RepID=UPI002C1D24EF|nr:hydroxylase [Nocardioides sp.]HTW15894.1 hydroxylase [Nocardioides sp.]